MSKRTVLVVFLTIAAILALMALEIHLIDRPRAPVITEEHRFLEQSAGVLDTETGLLWALPAGPAGLFAHKAAGELCRKADLNGRTDWRLPLSDELKDMAHCGPRLKRCRVVLSREQRAVCLRRRRGRPSWSFWTGDETRRCRDAKGKRPLCARAVRIYRGDCGEYGAVTGMRTTTSALRVMCVRAVRAGKFSKP